MSSKKPGSPKIEDTLYYYDSTFLTTGVKCGVVEFMYNNGLIKFEHVNELVSISKTYKTYEQAKQVILGKINAEISHYESMLVKSCVLKVRLESSTDSWTPTPILRYDI